MALNGVSWREFVCAYILSIVFTITLFYITIEIPISLDRVLRQYFPDVFYDIEARENALSMLRPVGYLSLAITVALIALGFVIKRSKLALLGSLALYIPIFGYFAFAMFFLAGIGILRVLWLPIIDLDPSFLNLGCIAYIPLLPLAFIPYLLYYLDRISLIMMFFGIFVFFLGVATWLYGKFKGYDIVDFWIYRYSRHPQYLGFIIWSYGLLIYIHNIPYVYGAFTKFPTLIWIISTMLVVGVALLEELNMVKKFGDKYEEYRKRTPFMAPLPKSLWKIVALPMKIVRGYPKNVKQVVAVVVIYIAVSIALCYLISLINYVILAYLE